jgi:hypothetical protein
MAPYFPVPVPRDFWLFCAAGFFLGLVASRAKDDDVDVDFFLRAGFLAFFPLLPLLPLAGRFLLLVVLPRSDAALEQGPHFHSSAVEIFRVTHVSMHLPVPVVLCMRNPFLDAARHLSATEQLTKVLKLMDTVGRLVRGATRVACTGALGRSGSVTSGHSPHSHPSEGVVVPVSHLSKQRPRRNWRVRMPLNCKRLQGWQVSCAIGAFVGAAVGIVSSGRLVSLGHAPHFQSTDDLNNPMLQRSEHTPLGVIMCSTVPLRNKRLQAVLVGHSGIVGAKVCSSEDGAGVGAEVGMAVTLTGQLPQVHPFNGEVLPILQILRHLPLLYR